MFAGIGSFNTMNRRRSDSSPLRERVLVREVSMGLVTGYSPGSIILEFRSCSPPFNGINNNAAYQWLINRVGFDIRQFSANLYMKIRVGDHDRNFNRTRGDKA